MSPSPVTSSPTRSLVLLLTWLLLYFAVRLWLEAHPAMAASSRLALAFLPTPFFAWFLLSFVRLVRGGDELEQRIQLEALALAFPLGLLLLTTLGLVQRAVTLNFEDWSYNHVWPIFISFYFAGYFIARRRYA